MLLERGYSTPSDHIREGPADHRDTVWVNKVLRVMDKSAADIKLA